MIPIYDDNPTRRLPWMTTALIALNTLVFAFELTGTPPRFEALVATYAFVPAEFFGNPTAPRSLMTVLTSMFLHAGWLHLGGNMLYLWIFGNNVEDRIGPVRYLLFYLACGIVAALAQGATNPGATLPLVGASGAVAGVLGGYLLLYPRARVVTLIPIFFYVELAALPAVFVIGFWFALQVAQGVTALGGMLEGGVAWWAHIGGFVAGLVLLGPTATASILARRRRR